MASISLHKKKTPVKKKLKKDSFPIVAIGASLGGLKAVSELFRNLPVNTGMAYIYVQHLSPDHKSFLTSILSKTTKMKVQEIEEMEHMIPDNIYVIPYNKGIKVTDGHIKLIPRSKTSLAISIDVLFSSLAETHEDNVIGIVLSGNANDGTAGLKAIKDAGGLTFAQDKSAEAGSMPRSAIDAGVVDFILPPKGIAAKLARLSKKGLLKTSSKGIQKVKILEDDDPALKSIFGILHKKTGVDFNHYKTASVKRRLHHKMLQCGAENITEYEKLLTKKNNEVDLLYKDLLINVTNFFRDPETFRYLKSTFLPRLIKSKIAGETLRIWVPACSSGEEAYSMAMLITELQENKVKKIPVQIFATDLSEPSIQTARIGEYSENDMRAVSEKRRKRFFVKTGDRYRIVKELREMCVFALHNILSDPPFFRIDFISCRNLLIYFDAVAQKKALSTFHFGLNDNSYLMLGKSETIGTASQLFTQSNTKFKIYSRKKNTGNRKIPELLPRLHGKPTYGKSIKLPLPKKASVDSMELDGAINSVLLSNYMPACAIINKEMEILQFRGSTSLYLSHSQGKASLNILKMMRPEFSFELRNAIHLALKTKQAVIKSGIEMKIDSIFRMVTLEVSPLKIEWDEPLLLIVFSFQEQVEKYIESNKDKKNNSDQKDRKIQKLAEELNNARAEMHSVIESQENAYEELQIANEEIVSTNEEFQTLNEELETSKEEIEATNEELTSTNQELHIRNELLTESYEYSEAIISTVHEPLIILDEKNYVKSANKSFYKKFHTTKEQTEGISLFELGNKQWNIPKLHELLKNVLFKNVDFDSFEVTQTFPGIGEKIMLLNAHRIVQKNHREQLTLLAIDDITERSHSYMREKELLNKDLHAHKADNKELEKAEKRKTRQLEQKNKELENANKDLTSFTYVSSHDLQEPLRKIQNFVSCILEEEEKNLSDTGKEYFRRMTKTAKRMQGLIEDLLTYSRAKSGQQVFESTDLTLVWKEVVNEFEETILEKKAIIKALPLGYADVIPFQFRQLFQNLISNSLKFTRAGVAPHISLKGSFMLGGKTGQKGLLPKTKYLHLVYTDNGIGFDVKYKERIFQVFQRLQNVDQYAGTGIGLAICKRIIENHHGVITATGKENKGARFDIFIPVITWHSA